MKNSIKILIFTVLIMGSISSNAQCVKIIGAGTSAVNGTYSLASGTNSSGYPYYEHSGGSYYIGFSGSYWTISTSNISWSGTTYYYTYSPSATADLSTVTWTTYQGSNPAPTGGYCYSDDSCVLSASLDTVCFGNSTTLSPAGILANGSNWYLYQDSLSSTPIDSGTSIVVTPPNAATAYYCRAESSSSSFTGDSSLITITVTNTPGKPTISGCGNSNDTITLTTDSSVLTTYLWGISNPPETWDTTGTAGFSAGYAYYTSLTLDSSGTPYVVYMDQGNGNKATVMKYNGTSWVNVGTAGFSAGQANYTSLALDGSGTPYVAYQDVVNSNKATVMKYNGTSWVTVGSAGFSAGSTGYNSLALDGSGTPYVAYQDVVNSYKATVMKYNGSSWANVGSAGFSAGSSAYTSLALDVSGTPYVAYQDVGNSNKATVMKYNGSSWANVGSAGFSAGYAYNTSLALDSSGTPYVVYIDQGNSYKATVMKYNGSYWVTVGTAGFSAGQANYTSLALESSGTPYVAYQDAGNSHKANVMKFYAGIAGMNIEATDTSKMMYLRATYANGCIVDADPIKACETKPISLPSIAGTTYQSNGIVNDGSWLHYCDCDKGYRLLSLDTTGSGAVVPADSVWLRLGANKTQSWTDSGGMVTNLKGGAMIVRQWEVSPSTEPTSTVGVKYYFTQDEFLAVKDTLANHNGGASGYGSTLNSPADMSMYKIASSGKFVDPHTSGVTGIALSDSTIASTTSWVYTPYNSGHSAEYKVSSFSGGGGGGGGGGGTGAAPLPVELIHFTAQAAAHTTAELTWATASEIDNSHFMIERSYDGEHFEEVARVEGNGNSSEVLHYAYIDMSIAKGTQVVYYRLHQFDYNGVSEYSDVRRVTFGMNNQDEQNIAIYPNPFTSDVYIDLRTISGGEATITVTNINGQQLLERSINTTEQIEKVDLSSLTKGMYFVNVTSDIGTTIVKVIKR